MKGVADYTFIEHLGDGNHGAFWLAFPPERLGRRTDQPVAVKTLAHRANDDDYRRMANELRVYALVDSPDLVRVIDAGHDRGQLFYAMPYLAEGSLAEPSVGLAPAAIVEVVAAAARAAHQLHDVGIAHRDIKPSNILIDQGRGKLSDLGLAQIVNPGHAATGIGPVGTIEYLAPEVVRGERASRSSDVWSLGVTLHSALSGRTIYEGLPDGSLIEALRHVLSDQPSIDRTLAAPIVAIIERCLMPDPSNRYRTAADLAAALQGVST